jgi:hypothetical protein
MKVYIVMETVYGDWMEDNKDVKFVKAVFDSLDKANQFVSMQPLTTDGGWNEEYIYDDNGDVIDSNYVSMYQLNVSYYVSEFEIQ